MDNPEEIEIGVLLIRLYAAPHPHPTQLRLFLITLARHIQNLEHDHKQLRRDIEGCRAMIAEAYKRKLRASIRQHNAEVVPFRSMDP